MKELPIIFNTQMVKAILDGRKTQSRRPLKVKMSIRDIKGGLDLTGAVPERRNKYNFLRLKDGDEYGGPITSPFGIPGDLLYVRETFAIDTYCKAQTLVFKTKKIDPDYPIKWKPSIHMPKKYARIWLKVKRVWVERVQDISPHDCVSEGIKTIHDRDGCATDKVVFSRLWNSIYGTWDKNHWVWACEFERTEKP